PHPPDSCGCVPPATAWPTPRSPPVPEPASTLPSRRYHGWGQQPSPTPSTPTQTSTPDGARAPPTHRGCRRHLRRGPKDPHSATHRPGEAHGEHRPRARQRPTRPPRPAPPTGQEPRRHTAGACATSGADRRTRTPPHIARGRSTVNPAQERVKERIATELGRGRRRSNGLTLDALDDDGLQVQ